MTDATGTKRSFALVAFALCAWATASGGPLHGAESDPVLADFEGGDYGAWRAEGEAFGLRPLASSPVRPIKLTGFLGQGLAGSGPGQEAATGVLLSPSFKVERRFINFLVWGERNQPAVLGVELLLDSVADKRNDRVVWAASATEAFDPERLLHYQGQWHLFHQHRPPGSAATVWGNAVSDDLLRWRHLPVAIPSTSLDSNFSGSGMVDWANASGLKRGNDPPLLLFYTLHPDSRTLASGERKCDQRLAYSTDGGRTFEPYPGNPLLRTPDRYDRDPKVFIERFGNRGEVTHSGIFFADPANRALTLTVQGGAAHLRWAMVRELKSIWIEAANPPPSASPCCNLLLHLRQKVAERLRWSAVRKCGIRPLREGRSLGIECRSLNS